MSDLTHRFVETNGIRMYVAEQGDGPLVVLLHGFPESWYSWRHQLRGLSNAGYRVVAPDQRGYGQTDRPTAVSSYTMLHLVGDVVGMIDALGETQAVVVGHDWGAPVAWNTALMRPDLVRGVVGLSVPYRPRGSTSSLSAMRRRLGEGFYQAYFQQPGVADSELGRDVRSTLRRVLYGLSGDGARDGTPPEMVVPAGGGLLDVLADATGLPAWLTEADLDVYVAEFERTGFTGGLNWYRNLDLSWELMAPWLHAKVLTPALYVAGDRDVVVNFPGMDRGIPSLTGVIPNLRDTIMLPGCGHWTQQERSDEVNAAILRFLAGL